MVKTRTPDKGFPVHPLQGSRSLTSQSRSAPGENHDLQLDPMEKWSGHQSFSAQLTNTESTPKSRCTSPPTYSR